jgi:hypothetical protein
MTGSSTQGIKTVLSGELSKWDPSTKGGKV